MAATKYFGSAGLQELVTKIKTNYATKSELPTAVSELTNDSNYQDATQVSASISSAIAGVTQFDYQIVPSLPATGTKGVVYLVPNSGTGTNVYDEYIWVVVEEVGRFELFGERMVEVVEYVGDGTNVTIADGTGENAGKKVVSLTSSAVTSLAAADSAVQSVTSTGSTVTVTGTGTTKNIEVSSTIVDGAAAGATAVQPSDIEMITAGEVDALFDAE